MDLSLKRRKFLNEESLRNLNDGNHFQRVRSTFIIGRSGCKFSDTFSTHGEYFL